MLARCLPGLLPPDAPRPVRMPGMHLTPRGVAKEFALAAGGTLILDDLPALTRSGAREMGGKVGE